MLHADDADDWARMKPITPRGYVCYRAPSAITIDGKPDDAAWAAAPWSEAFIDIEGDAKPRPRFRTRMKMLWDDRFLYVAAEMEEPHVCATLTEKNSVIYRDNDFEVFIDPDGDNHNYYEFEVNALNTIWELTLPRPYKDGGKPKLGTNLDGLLSGVHVDGTVNDPRDTDRGWSVEVAIPWNGLAPYNPGRAAPPEPGEQWRVNFSRVEWAYDVADGRYVKRQKPEDNWVWSPQGIIDMHRPERWGYVQFSTAEPGSDAFRPDPTLAARDALMTVYHAQKSFIKRAQRWARSLEDLMLETPGVELRPTDDGFVASTRVTMPDGTTRTLHTRQDSRIWSDDAR